MKRRKKIALVLGGGGALGCAHIGVIKTLEKYNIPIDIVVGTSMGGIVGAAYASGLSTEKMTELARKFRTIDLVDFNFDNSGLFTGKGVMRTLNKFIPDVNVESLPKAFACVAVDLKTENEYVFKMGPLRTAVRATMSIPGIFTPVKYEDKLLVDGGLLNNLPEDIAMEMGADIIISCDVINKYRLKHQPKSAIECLFYSMNIGIKEMQKVKSCHSDILITPDLNGMSQLGYNKDNTEFAIKRGAAATLKEIDNIIQLINEE